MIRKVMLLFLFGLLSLFARAQYPPQVGLAGSDAISGSSSRFVGWATHCSIQRGYQNIADPSLGNASDGDSIQALGPADGQIVSLGDSGIAVLSFAHPIIDGPGPDFAVFENGFRDPVDSSLAFLELGFVEVSSDGINYFRFSATSLTSDAVQVTNSTYIDATKINNLAGKYIATYGTPFDLHELAGIPGLDVNNVTHIRVIDAIGAVTGEHYTTDSAGRKINDPYPTPFPSCGFDLDAVGVLNQSGTGIQQVNNEASVIIFPNPAKNKINISMTGKYSESLKASLSAISGYILAEFALPGGNTSLSLDQYPAGIYLLTIRNEHRTQWVEKIIKY